MTTRLLPYLVIVILSGILNWLIPLLIYAGKFGLFKKRTAGFVGCNFWGIVMDVVLAGMIDTIILKYLFIVSAKPLMEYIIQAFVLGFVIMVTTHIVMSITHWKEWIMPSPWRFNAGGYWHMISMTLQMAYCAYPLVIITQQTKLLTLVATHTTILAVLALASLFLFSLTVKHRDLEIGPIRISGKPW
ncbi:hypothetical protein M1271_03280 [Patescibacteria group bacterium]|nr:hypothetical protein [Patescibacteria group bacterium]